MSVGAFLGFLILNLVLVAGFTYIMMYRIEKRLKKLKAEIQEMEDLVVALVDELEETASAPPVSSEPVHPSVEPVFSQADLAIPNFPATFTLPEPSVEPETNSYLPKTFPLSEPSEPEPIVAASPRKPINDPKHQKILDLWRQGHEIPEIARRLTMGPGEIRLVLGLYKQN